MKAPNGCPCYDCSNRKLNCHSDCEPYKTWAESHKQARLNRQRQEMLERWRRNK